MCGTAGAPRATRARAAQLPDGDVARRGQLCPGRAVPVWAERSRWHTPVPCSALTLQAELKRSRKRSCVSLQGTGEDAGEGGKRDLREFPLFPSFPPKSNCCISTVDWWKTGRLQHGGGSAEGGDCSTNRGIKNASVVQNQVRECGLC